MSWNQSNQNSQSEDRYISQGANNIAKKKAQEYASKQVVIHFSFKPGCVTIRATTKVKESWNTFDALFKYELDSIS